MDSKSIIYTHKVYYLSQNVLAWLVLSRNRMTNTEFITRQKNVEHHPLLKSDEIYFHATDGALILGFLAMFVGLVLLLSK